MAEENEVEIEEKKGGSKLLIIIIVVLVLAVAGLAAVLLMGGDEKGEPAEDAEPVAEVKQSPIYYSIESPFIINFSDQSKGAVRYLQIKLKVMARDQTVIDAIELNLPQIQHELLLLLYAQDYEILNTTGTQQLQQDVLDKVNEILVSRDIKKPLEAVYFTSFLMQ